MFPNLGIVALAALIPILVGFLYYNPKTLGGVWMKAAGVSPDAAKNANMLIVFGLSLLFSFMMALILFSLVVHQTDLYSMVAGEEGFMKEGSKVMEDVKTWMDAYGTNFRTFKHGAFHGALLGIFFLLPVMGTNALFERKGGRYIFINAGYWIITTALMGGVLCQWG